MITYEKIKVEEFIPIFQEHYGNKHNECYMRTPQAWAEVAMWREDAYIFRKNGKCIGGVLQPGNIVTGLFTVAPYENYAQLLKVLIDQLEDKEYVFYEVPDTLSSYYHDGFKLDQSEVLMYMKTDHIEATLCNGYQASLIEEEDTEAIGSMLHKAFVNDRVYKHVDPVEEFINSAKGFFNHIEGHDHLYNATKKITNQDGHIVGAILTMMDAGHPFAYNLGVDPAHQRKGLGKYLLSSLVNDISDHYDSVRLFVHLNNPIRRMYESVGFQYGVAINTYSFNKSKS